MIIVLWATHRSTSRTVFSRIASNSFATSS
jgi:hypothetical protein